MRRPPLAGTVRSAPAEKSLSFKQIGATFQAILAEILGRSAGQSVFGPARERSPEAGEFGGGRRHFEPPADGVPGREPEGDLSGARTGIDVLELSLACASPASERPAGLELSGATRALPSSSMELTAALVEAVLSRIAWGGDRRRGVAKLELDGALAGTTIWVAGAGRDVELEIELGPNTVHRDLPERLERRLLARGLVVRALSVR